MATFIFTKMGIDSKQIRYFHLQTGKTSCESFHPIVTFKNDLSDPTVDGMFHRKIANAYRQRIHTE
jgi:hypothetical protein